MGENGGRLAVPQGVDHVCTSKGGAHLHDRVQPSCLESRSRKWPSSHNTMPVEPLNSRVQSGRSAKIYIWAESTPKEQPPWCWGRKYLGPNPYYYVKTRPSHSVFQLDTILVAV
eukprot:3622974-Amphidinium_carterae.1